MKHTLVFTLGLILFPVFAPAQQRNATVTINTAEFTGPIEMGRMALGQGGLSDQPMWEGREAEIRSLRPRLIRLFIQEYFDLLPAKGRYRFDRLDRSVDLILRSGAKPLMSIVVKPRLLYPKLDESVVFPNDWEEWERLISALVRHYKERGDGIRYWEVGNEPDQGEEGGCPYKFRPEDYVSYYQHTARAILAADPSARVGGPALANWESPILPALLEACSRENLPLHFVSWHGYTSDPAWFGRSTEEVKKLLARYPKLRVETMIDEWNLALMTPKDDDLIVQTAFVPEAIWHMLEAGLDYSCYYQIRDYHVDPTSFSKFMSPHGVAFMASWWNRRPQYDGLFDFQNEVRPAYFAFKLLSRLSGRRVNAQAEGIHAIASFDPEYEMENVLIWNFSAEPVRATIHWRGLKEPTRVEHIELNARDPRTDEASRLRFLKPADLAPGTTQTESVLAPYGVELWFFRTAATDLTAEAQRTRR